ncbi:MAG TPA: glucokinase [Thioalkalivibrio sp.]|nr:glucokinase [Thioalkalivibrio sp.]
MKVLAADIGGTKTLLAIARLERGRLHMEAASRFESAAFEDFDTLVRGFLRQGDIDPRHLGGACLAIAGPVAGDAQRQTAQLTNLPWQLDNGALTESLGIPRVSLINDFEGIAHSLGDLPDSALATLQAGQPDPTGPRLVVGAGTGLGVCAVCPGGQHLLPGEGGHAGFSPVDAQQVRLWQFVTHEEGRCTREHLLSGRGIARIAAFLQTEGHAPGPALSDAMAEGDPAAALSHFALRGEDPLARETLRLFVRLYGAQAGDLALGMLPRGGVYLAGGIAPRILPLLQNGDFISAFSHKPPMSHLLAPLPVKVILEPHAGLVGAARWALRGLKH